jgi:hypothetical protein
MKASDPRYSDPKRIVQHAFQVCSQGGEDGIVQEVFKRIGTTNRVFFESGVGDGIENNTSFLLSLGWTGYWIDANPRFTKTVERMRLKNKTALRHIVEKLDRENAVSLLERLNVPRDLDFLSLDIDQNTWHVWGAIARSYRPRLAAIEYNGVIPPHIDWKVQYDAQREWNGTHNYGASLKAYENLGREVGYSLVGCDPFGTDAFFVRDDLLQDHFAAPYTAQNHFEPARFHLIHRMGLPNEILDPPA